MRRLSGMRLADRDPNEYRGVAPDEQLDGSWEQARASRGMRVAHVSSTGYGGGVAELLRSVVALERGLGLDAHWLVLHAEEEFFRFTKGMHSALQGHPELPLGDETYLQVCEQLAGEIADGAYDVVIVHDPQPLPMRLLGGDKGARWIWRCHIDTARPNPDALTFVEPFVEPYDALVFTLPDFAFGAGAFRNVSFVPPGIAPMTPKNMPLTEEAQREIVRWFSLDPSRPLLVQVSRFDAFKDPLGVLEVYERARRDVPGLQLALLGSLAFDDPEGRDLYQETVARAERDPDVYVGTNETGVGNVEINAFQRRADVVVQKSSREGFALSVAEALWKESPVVAGRTGGIQLQMPNGVGGTLVAGGLEEFADAVVALLSDGARAKELADRGREHIREHFLVTRVVADELRLIASCRPT